MKVIFGYIPVLVFVMLLVACGAGESGGGYGGSSSGGSGGSSSSGGSSGGGSVSFSVWTSGGNDVTELTPSAISAGSCSSASCIDFTGGGISNTAPLTVDANGNVWVVNGLAGPPLNVTEITAAAVASGGCSSATCLNYTWSEFGDVTDIATDSNGNVWLAIDCQVQNGSCNFPDFSQYLGVISPNGGVVEIKPGAAQDCSSGCVFFTIPMDPNTGYPLIRPQGVTIDLRGNVWFTSDGCTSASNCSSDSFMGSVVEITSAAVQAGSCASGCSIYSNNNDTTGNIMSPEGIAADSGGNVWVVNNCGPGNCISNVSGSVTEIKAGAASDCSTGCVDFTGGGLNQPVPIVFDSAGNAWIGNSGASTMTEITSAGVAAGACSASSCVNYNLNSEPGLLGSIAIDSNGNIWTAGGQIEEVMQGASLNCASGCITIEYASGSNIAVMR